MRAAIIGAGGFLGRACADNCTSKDGKYSATMWSRRSGRCRACNSPRSTSSGKKYRCPRGSKPSTTWPNRRDTATFPRRRMICSA